VFFVRERDVSLNALIPLKTRNAASGFANDKNTEMGVIV